MTENTTNPSEEPYDPSKDPDSDPEQLASAPDPQQPDQAEGEDDPTETGGA